MRATVRCEASDAPASLLTAAIRLADQIGLTPAGLRENGWELEELPGSRALAESDGASGEPAPAGKVPQPPPATPLRSRLKVVKRAGGE